MQERECFLFAGFLNVVFFKQEVRVEPFLSLCFCLCLFVRFKNRSLYYLARLAIILTHSVGVLEYQKSNSQYCKSVPNSTERVRSSSFD